MKLTKNFNLREFFVSKEYPDLARGGKYMRTPDVDKMLFLLSYLILQPVRNYVKLPIQITSGYRSEVLNNKVGGSAHSLHLSGMAADITINDKSQLPQLYNYIKTILDGRYGELILYLDKDATPIFIHVSLPVHGKTQLKLIKRSV